MQTNKVTVYTTLDGKKFYGAENKTIAASHDHDLQNDLKSAKYDSAVGQILIDGYPVFSGKYKDLEEYNILVNEDPDVGEKWKKFMDGLEESVTCPNDLEDFTNFADMISDVVDEIGGMKNVQKILDVVNKHYK